jgi:hypothetical protein
MVGITDFQDFLCRLTFRKERKATFITPLVFEIIRDVFKFLVAHRVPVRNFLTANKPLKCSVFVKYMEISNFLIFTE